jgi:excisionase family DNA binding protein
MAEKVKHYTTYEVSKICGVAPITVGRWIQAGKLKAFRTVGGHRRILASSLDRFLAAYKIPRARDEDVRKVLIVDDDETLIDVTRGLLETVRSDLTIRGAKDGFEAGRLVESFRPQLVFLDLMMPGIDGFEVLRRIKEDPSTEGVEIVGLTGYFNEENRSRLMEAGALECLRKPANKEKLAEILKRVFESEE